MLAGTTQPDPFPVQETIDGNYARGLLLLADHAGRAMPARYGNLGLPSREFDRHIAYDIGIEGLTRGLAAALDVPAVMCPYSRLLIDPNRGEDDPTAIRQLYDGTVIAGNYPLSEAERQHRFNAYYHPYHAAVDAASRAVEAAHGGAPLIISLHSFTPVMQGRVRPWHVGILWDLDDRAVRPLLDAFSADPALTVGDNEPYDGALRGDTMYTHAIARGFAHALIEIRQDLIADQAGLEAWVARLSPILEALNGLPDIHTVEYFGSRTGPVDYRKGFLSNG